MNIRYLTIILSLGVALSACTAHLNQQQCLTMNWQQLGFSDGAAGRGPRDLIKDAQDCAKFNIDINRQAYNSAYRNGLRQYCRPETAYRLGVNGQALPTFCPADLQPRFKASWKKGLTKYCIPENAYQLGRSGKPMPKFCPLNLQNEFRIAYLNGYQELQRQRAINQQISQQSNTIHRQQQTIDDLETKLDDISWQLLNGRTRGGVDLSYAQRRELRDMRRRYQQDIRFAREQIEQAQRQKARLERRR